MYMLKVLFIISNLIQSLNLSTAGRLKLLGGKQQKHKQAFPGPQLGADKGQCCPGLDRWGGGCSSCLCVCVVSVFVWKRIQLSDEVGVDITWIQMSQLQVCCVPGNGFVLGSLMLSIISTCVVLVHYKKTYFWSCLGLMSTELLFLSLLKHTHPEPWMELSLVCWVGQMHRCSRQHLLSSFFYSLLPIVCCGNNSLAVT